MSIIINDLDKLLIDFCDLESDFFSFMCINKHYYKLISNNELFMQWKKCYSKVITTKYLVVLDSSKNALFIKSCKHGLLLFSKYLVSKYAIDIHYNSEYPLQYSCKKGHINVAKWLIELCSKPGSTLIDIHADADLAFEWSRIGGHLDVAKWLIDLSKTPGYTPFSDDLIAKYYHPKKLIS